VLASLSALAGLVLPRRCAGCGAAATWWCADCAAATGDALLVAPLTPPIALPIDAVGRVGDRSVPCVSAARYDGPAGRALVAFKEHAVVSLRRPLVDLLALAVDRAIGDAARRRGAIPPAVVLVPVPSRRSAVRARGQDVVAQLARGAAARLRAQGLDVRCVPALRHVRRVRDQAGLGREERQANLSGALVARPVAVSSTSVPSRGLLLLVVDDVVTTGATLAEAVRALRCAFPEHEIGTATVLRA
jgi:predicted amidophosphoribosyltransferase